MRTERHACAFADAGAECAVIRVNPRLPLPGDATELRERGITYVPLMARGLEVLREIERRVEQRLGGSEDGDKTLELLLAGLGWV